MKASNAALDALTKYEWLLRVSEPGRERLVAAAHPIHVSPSVVLLEGDRCGSITLLMEGCLRVTKRRASGRAISLYTVGPGELCVLETLAVLTGLPFRAEAAVEAPVTGLAVPGDIVRSLVQTEPELRDALFRTFEARLAAALDLIGDVALETLESRLATRLLRGAGGRSDIHVTHEQLAHELACAREAVSRILEQWEHAGWVALGRGRIHVTAPDHLTRLASAAEAGSNRR